MRKMDKGRRVMKYIDICTYGTLQVHSVNFLQCGGLDLDLQKVTFTNNDEEHSIRC